MDAFAVAIVTGLTLNPLTKRHVFRLSFHFGLFQALMPIIGWAAGRAVYRYIAEFDHWVAFGLLTFIGTRMLWGAVKADREESKSGNDPTSGGPWSCYPWQPALMPLLWGFLSPSSARRSLLPGDCDRAGCRSLYRRRHAARPPDWFPFGSKRVEAMGGVILVAIGIKILVEHLSA